MATLQELLQQARNTQQTPTWGSLNEVGQWTANPEMIGAPTNEVGQALPGYSQQLQGPTSQQALDQILYGAGRQQEFAKSALQQIAQSSGLPTNFDWTPYLEKAAQQHYDQFGQGYSSRYTNYAQPVAAAVQLAAQTNPQLQPFVEKTQPGSSFWDQGNQIRDQYLSSDKKAAADERYKLASVFAGPVLGAMGAFGSGAGASATAGFGEAAYAGGGAAAAGGAGALGASTGSNMLLADAGAGSTMTDVSPGLMDVTQGTSAGVGGAAGTTTATGGATTAAPVGGTTGGTLGTTAAGGTMFDQIFGGTGESVSGSYAPQSGELGAAANSYSTTGAYSIPYADIFRGAVGLYGANQAKGNAQDLMNQVIASDQWRGQQPRYFEPLYNAATKGIGDTAYGRSLAEATARQDSAKGYNMSGNMLTDIAKSLNTGSMDYVRALTPLATGRGETGAASGALGSSYLGAQNQGVNAMGSILEALYRGQQPTAGSGKPPNQNLGQLYGLA